MSGNNVKITEVGSALFVARGRGVREYVLDPAEVAALREHFAAERMPEDVQKLVEEARGHITQLLLGIPESLHASVWRGEQSDPRVSLIARLLAALEAAYSKGVE